MNDYELMRLKNIERNKELLKDLGLDTSIVSAYRVSLDRSHVFLIQACSTRHITNIIHTTHDHIDTTHTYTSCRVIVSG